MYARTWVMLQSCLAIRRFDLISGRALLDAQDCVRLDRRGLVCELFLFLLLALLLDIFVLGFARHLECCVLWQCDAMLFQEDEMWDGVDSGSWRTRWLGASRVKWESLSQAHLNNQFSRTRILHCRIHESFKISQNGADIQEHDLLRGSNPFSPSKAAPTMSSRSDKIQLLVFFSDLRITTPVSKFNLSMFLSLNL